MSKRPGTYVYMASVERGNAIMEGYRDYSICRDSADGKHDPKPAFMHDREMPEGYLTIECSQCGQTTGYPMPDAEDITWD